MNTNNATLIKRLEECETILEIGGLWPGAVAGYRREITTIKKKLINAKRTDAGDHKNAVRAKYGK